MGERVTAKYLATSLGVRCPGSWYGGTIVRVHADGSCDISYDDDGDGEKAVKPKFIRDATAPQARPSAGKRKAPPADQRRKVAAPNASVHSNSRPSPDATDTVPPLAREQGERKGPPRIGRGALSAQAIAEEDGLTLARIDSDTGFRNVVNTRSHDKPPFMAYCYTCEGHGVCYSPTDVGVKLKGRFKSYKRLVRRDIGRFATAADAALALARHIAKSGLLQRDERDMSSAEALQAARKERLELVPSDDAYSGYLGVMTSTNVSQGRTRPYMARTKGGGRNGSLNLGYYARPEAAALELARHYRQVAISTMGPSQRQHTGAPPPRLRTGRRLFRRGTEKLCFCATDRHLPTNDVPFEGAWVQCDWCSRWCHAECAGLEPNEAEELESYRCPPCDVDDREGGGEAGGESGGEAEGGEVEGGEEGDGGGDDEGDDGGICRGESGSAQTSGRASASRTRHPLWEFVVETRQPPAARPEDEEGAPCCSICLEGFSGASGDPSLPDGWGQTPCGHCHHYRCLSRWLASEEYDSVCPQCRHAVSKSRRRMLK